jgi:hypothetical protein
MERLKISLLVFLQSSDGFSHRFGQSLIRIQFQHVLDHHHEIVAASVTGIRQDFNKIDCWSQQIWHPSASMKGRRVP